MIYKINYRGSSSTILALDLVDYHDIYFVTKEVLTEVKEDCLPTYSGWVNNKIIKQWKVNGIHHKIGGPAIIWEYEQGDSNYYINGVNFRKKDYWKKIK